MQKQGKVVAVVKKGEVLDPHLPPGISDNRIKFTTGRATLTDRVLVEVERGGKKVGCDYYAPYLSNVKVVK